jgi:hypothetical protein
LGGKRHCCLHHGLWAGISCFGFFHRKSSLWSMYHNLSDEIAYICFFLEYC